MRIVILLLAIFLYLSIKRENMMYMPRLYNEYIYTYHVGTDGKKRLDHTGGNIYYEDDKEKALKNYRSKQIKEMDTEIDNYNTGETKIYEFNLKKRKWNRYMRRYVHENVTGKIKIPHHDIKNIKVKSKNISDISDDWIKENFLNNKKIIFLNYKTFLLNK